MIDDGVIILGMCLVFSAFGLMLWYRSLNHGVRIT